MNLARLYHTLRPLRAVQWTDRLLRPTKARLLRARIPAIHHLDAARALPQVSLPRFATPDTLDPKTGAATFLNLSHRFNPDRIDWNFSGLGKLWTYHLNYFGWLERVEDVAVVEEVMRDFCRRTDTASTGAEIYPASRRIQHWIDALLRHGIRDEKILARLYADAWRVARLPEYHLQANHLLQNGLAMAAAAHFFKDEALYRQAEILLWKELPHQFFADGAHIERSASYTADLCARMLWLLHLQAHTDGFRDADLNKLLWSAAAKSLSWLESYRFPDDRLAHIGDSSPDGMPTLAALRKAAALLNIYPKVCLLHESGYRKARAESWEAVINIGAPTPAYQPGHSHADTLSFCIHADGKPLVMDAGISTYERNARRAWERSTEAHNTVAVDGRNSSDVWGSFRVGRRARVEILREENLSITAAHDGYARRGLRHIRSFDWGTAENVLTVADCLEGKCSHEAVSFLHFHPDVRLTQIDESEWRADGCSIHFRGMASIVAEPYQWAAGFNLLRPASRLHCRWRAAKTEIRFHF